MADYEFRYSPLTGRLTGKQMIEQTEQAINQLSSLVDSAAGQVEIISTLANESNENAATALEVANEALATTGRTYITVSTQTDANNYYDSQLIYIADSTSTNIPVADTGMLEVKTNDNKTACEQVFIAASSGDAYYRHGAITAETVGDVTTYSVTWSGWSSQPASQTYVQQELTNYLPLSGGTVTGGLTVTGTLDGTASGNLPLTGGGSITGDVDITGDLSVSGAITGNVTGNVTGTATRAIKDGNGKNIASTYLPAVVGAVVAFAGMVTPQGWLLCDGSAVSRTDYATLYAVIGTTYGAGDGSTTFNLPNLVDKFVEGSATAGTVKSAGLPNITGGFRAYSYSAGDGNGAFNSSVKAPNALRGATDQNLNWISYTFDASRSNSIYGISTTVQPPALTMRYIIKY